jgi:hypothetical protein
MKAVAIIALVFGALSIMLPVVGVFLAMLCSVLALISFRSQPTLSGITFGLNIVSTAFMSPSLVIAEAVNASAGPQMQTALGGGAPATGSIYLFYVGFHIVLLAAAIVWRLIRGAPKPAAREA